MIPIALLPAAGILLAIGTSFQDPNLVVHMPFLGNELVVRLLNLMSDAGSIIFSNLPLIFAVGVAIGLSNGDGVAGLAAIVGFLIMNITIGNVLEITPKLVETNRDYSLVMGIPTLQIGVFGGIIVGLLAAYLYKKYYKISLPSWLQFFAGKRFVPIVTAFSALILGVIMAFAWPYVQNAINTVSHFATTTNPAIAAFIFGFVERLTIPFGLNHVWWPTFWLGFGEYMDKAGNVVRGNQLIFFSQLKDNVEITAGTFMSGMGTLKMFGIPAAALAIYHTAKPEKKAFVKGLMISGAVTSIICGITEPIEFTFIFVAPILFVLHALITGLGFAILAILNVHVGLSFSGGFIDFLLFGILPGQGKTNWLMVIPVGLVIAAIYYFGFRFAITKWNLATPGREKEEEINAEQATLIDAAESLSEKVLIAFGGKDNITELNACMSRLRITVKDKDNVNKSAIKSLGAAGIFENANHIQAVFGMKADTIKEEMKILIQNGTLVNPTKTKVEEENKGETAISLKSFRKFTSPCSGQLMKIESIPDQVFSSKAMGDGFAIDIEDDHIVAPFDGEIMSIFPTKHAIALKDKYNHEVLIHIGLDTVTLKGNGFTLLVEEGQSFKKGDVLVTVNRNLIREKGLSLVTPVIFTNLDKEHHEIVVDKVRKVASGEDAIIHVENIENKHYKKA